MGITIKGTIECNECGVTAECVLNVRAKGKLSPASVPGQPGWTWSAGRSTDCYPELIVAHCPEHKQDDYVGWLSGDAT